jgi:hypothetical protein
MFNLHRIPPIPFISVAWCPRPSFFPVSIIPPVLNIYVSFIHHRGNIILAAVAS